MIDKDWGASEDLEGTLHSYRRFGSSTINKWGKYRCLSIGVSNEEIEAMSRFTGCSPGILPFSYLGLSIGSSMNYTINIEKAVLGSIGIYYMSIFKCPETVIHEIERLRAHFLWGGDQNLKKMSWIKWENILASFEKGGLGVGSLKAFNLALLQKWCWSGILANDTLKCKVGDGASMRFWKDTWLGDEPLSIRYNRLFRLDSNEGCLIKERLVNDGIDWIDDMRKSNALKEMMYVIAATTWWMLWKFRNNITFNTHTLRKSDIFDSLRLFSFY
uniref:RNA-directed DNA polymerase, eukaryota, reverse transcriptase zinc-binding domain protein n=1 Tax=Tanacetum cinerariifolium TaxID=118510 RepID=A0A6L2MWM5_TANCI|nr:hypothetical protein [Tanacetum cinerariifolium]